MPRGRPKGGKNKKWTVEEKLEIVKLNLEEHIGYLELQTKYSISKSQIHNWIHSYLDKGVEGLKNKKKTGNKFAALYISKSLTNEDRLELENMKLKIENERLKKGYLVKGVGANKVFVTLKEKNTKSSMN